MLETLRRHSKSWIVKVLFAILILSFGIWGVGDFVRGYQSNSPAITVGKASVSANELNAEFMREVNRLRTMMGGKFGTEEAKALGLLDRTVEQLASRLLVDQAAQAAGIMISDDTIRITIERMPVFRNEQGRFDRNRYQSVLAANNLTESNFVAMIRRDLIREQYMGSLSQAAAAPEILVRTLYLERNQRRVADVLTVNASLMGPVPAPDAATLEAFHSKNAARFRAPEYRNFTLVRLTRNDVMGDIKVSDKQLDDAFQAREHEFRTPDKRELEQILFASEADARKAAELLQQGQDFKAVAETVIKQAPDAIGWMAKDGLLAELAEPVFKLKAGETSGALESPLGWHIFRVKAVETGKGKTLAEVKDLLVKEITEEASVNALYELSTKIEDALGGGANLEEAAKKLNLKAERFGPVDSAGKTPDGKNADLPALEGLGEVVFSAPEGRESGLSETQDGYFIVRIESVTPARTRDYAEVKDKVEAEWIAEQRRELAQKRGEETLAKLKDGMLPAEVARTLGLKLETTQPLRRDGDGIDEKNRLPAPLLLRLFQIKAGESVLVPAEGNVLVARLRDVIPPDPDKDAEGMRSLRSGLRQILGTDLYQERIAALRERFPVKVDTDVLNSIGAEK